jgi:hypothetical protein
MYDGESNGAKDEGMDAGPNDLLGLYTHIIKRDES